MKFLVLIFLFSTQLVLAQNFSPSTGAGTQSSPGTLGNPNTTLGGGSTTLGGDFGSPGGSINNTSPTTEVNPQIPTVESINPSTFNLAPNPVPDNTSSSDFNQSLIDGRAGGTIQAEEEDPRFDLRPEDTLGPVPGSEANPETQRFFP